MGRKKQVQNLKVYLNKNQIGFLKRRTDGSVEFQYEDEWIDNGFAISLSLPLADRVFTGSKASFYFDNLLPDNKKILEAIAEKFGAPSTRSFDILSAVGRECVGALSFVDEEEDPQFLKKMAVRKLTESDIAKRLRGLASDTPLGMEDEGDFRISLAGAQEKMALLFRKNIWWEPRGSTPTSHILKKPIGKLFKGTTDAEIDFNTSVDNEWICLKLASIFGIDTAEAEIISFEDQRVLSVKRFDRVWDKEVLKRIPQEDFCQATGTSPILKYEKKGGPSLKAMMDLLLSSNNSEADRKMFFKTAMFNDLIYNTDSHAKNFSIFNLREGFLLTPMYDLLSAHFLRVEHSERYRKLKSSLSINDKVQYSEITLKDWKAEAVKCNLPASDFDEILSELKESVAGIGIPESELPEELDSFQLEQILEGIRARAKVVLQYAPIEI